MQAIDWDGRVKDASQALLSASARQDLLGDIVRYHALVYPHFRRDPCTTDTMSKHYDCASPVSPLAVGRLIGDSACRIEHGGAGVMHFHIEDPRCVQLIKNPYAAGDTGQIFNLVQEAQWDQILCVQSGQVSRDSDIADGPGSWSSHGLQADRQLHPHGVMAYPMRVGQTLRPIPATRGSSLAEVCYCLCAQLITTVHLQYLNSTSKLSKRQAGSDSVVIAASSAVTCLNEAMHLMHCKHVAHSKVC